jgi:hypothetical protein
MTNPTTTQLAMLNGIPLDECQRADENDEDEKSGMHAALSTRG